MCGWWLIRAVLDLGCSRERGRAAAVHLLRMMTAHPRADRQPKHVVGGCHDVVMSSTASSGATVVSPAERVDVLFDELAELAGQHNAIDGRIVEIVAELDRDELCGATGARSIAALVAWKMGSSAANAKTIATVAHRLEEFPRCAQGMREGRLSLDQVGVIADRAAEGSDAHYAELAAVATVSQLRTALKLNRAPNPNPILGRSRSARSPRPPTRRSATTGSNLVTPTPRSSTRRCSPIMMR